MSESPERGSAVWGDHPDGYGRISRWLHWLSAGILLISAPLAIYASSLPATPLHLILSTLHRSFGAALFCLLVLRLPWRAIQGWLRPLTPSGRMERTARFAHIALYILLTAAIFSGWAYSSAAAFAVGLFGLFVLPPLTPPDKYLADTIRTVHQVIVYPLLLLVAIHVAAAAYHHFVLKNRTILRMVGR